MIRVIKKLLIAVVIGALIIAVLVISSNNFDKRAKKCDEAYGYKCSYYQVINFDR